MLIDRTSTFRGNIVDHGVGSAWSDIIVLFPDLAYHQGRGLCRWEEGCLFEGEVWR